MWNTNPTPWNILVDWTVTVSGMTFMAYLISMAHRTAHALPSRRRKALRSATSFLGFCLLLAASGLFWTGPIHLHLVPVTLLWAGGVVLLGATAVGAWVGAFRSAWLK